MRISDGSSDVCSSGLADLDPAPLPDRIMDQAPVRAEQRAVDMNDLTPIFGLGPQLANQAGIIAVGNEADVLAVGLACNAQPQVASNVAHHALLQPAQREDRKSTRLNSSH